MDELREAVKRELRRRKWASERGKATRAYLRSHPELAEQFAKTGTIEVKALPAYVTKSSLLLELSRRAAAKEARRAVREWKKEHPEEVARLVQEVSGEQRVSAG